VHNGLGYEQCGFQHYTFSNRYVVYFYSLLLLFAGSPALLIAFVELNPAKAG
jgi:hypothetical protein